MGYYSTVSGEITFTPPIPWSEVEGGPFDEAPADARGMQKEIKFRAVEEVRAEGEWRMTRRIAVAVVPRWEGQFKAYHLTEHLQELVDRFGEGRTFSGRFEVEGEDAADIWRLRVRDGRAVEIKPIITWPDDEEAAP